MSTDTSYLIVGAGLAGAKAAQTLRQEGFDGPVVLIGEERERPNERPPLSKGYLLGSAERETIYVHPQQWYAEHDVDLRLGVAVTGIDPIGHEVRLADGSRAGYAKLLLTTGSSPRRLSVPGAGANGVHYLRSVADSERIKAAFAAVSRVAVIGAGWIGLETTAAARAAGAEVTVLEMAELPLLRVLGREVRRSSPTCTANTAWTSALGFRSPRSPPAAATSPGCAWPMAAMSRPARSSPGWESHRTASLPRPHTSRPATASWSTPSCVRPARTSMPPATSPVPTTRSSASTCGSSTGPTR